VANAALLAGYVSVGDRAFISGNVGIHQFVRIGRLAMLGAHSILTKDVPPFCTVHTATANGISGLNVVGLRRAGIGSTERKAIRQAFKVLYTSGLNVSQAKQRIAEQFPSGPANEFCGFIESSRRGLCGLASGRHKHGERNDS